MDLDSIDCSSKFFNDSVHGHIELHPLLVKIIDTPQFQRLRNIKQLGTCYYVYPGACHNRFEHCIGTCHLAGKVLNQVRLRSNKQICSEQDVLCVQIAALCHDIGHGPFSHMFDSQFIPEFRPNRKWSHEEGSCRMIDHLISENNLKVEFQKYGLDFELDLIFIKELINPPSSALHMEPYKGRSKDKYFLYEIVSNKQNGVDVDKWDYFARDCHHLGIPNSFDHDRVIASMAVVTVDGISRIAARDKDITQLYEMFHVRSNLHRQAYQHRVNLAIEAMICDAMKLANDHIFYKGAKGAKVKISDTIDDMFAYSRLTDNVIFEILNSDAKHPDMDEARSLVHRILTRDLYRYCAGARPQNHFTTNANTAKEFEKEIAEISNGEIKSEDIFVKIVRINYGSKAQNPLERFLFYSKNSPGSFVMLADEISAMLPKIFQDHYVQVFCRERSHKKATVEAFNKWCPTHQLSPLRAGLAEGLTPQKEMNHFNDSNGNNAHDNISCSPKRKCQRQLY